MTIQIPKGAEKYILFQRTGYLWLAGSKNALAKLLYRLLMKICSFNRYVQWEALLFPARVRAKFSEDMNNEYAAIKDYLPVHAKNVLDIGCGIAGIDALLYEHYGDGFEVYLLDKTAVDEKVFYYFQDTGSFYNSFALTRDFLVLNNVPASQIHTQEATNDNQISFETEFDLVISLISWGFHYPVSTYLDRVYMKMRSGGSLIIDVRKDTGGEELLQSKFGSVQTIYDDKRYKRLLAIKR